MSKCRRHLPQLEGGVFLTDGGLETTLIFHQGVDLPHFAAFDLLRDAAAAKRSQTITFPISPLPIATDTGSFLIAPRGAPALIGAQRSDIQAERSRP